MGRKGLIDCYCPVRLAPDTVSLLILRLFYLFEGLGLGRPWDAFLGVGNPAAAASVKESVQEEQAWAHIVPRQAKPIFISKIRAIASFIQRELEGKGMSTKEKYVLLREQAWFKLQFVAGDRAGDLAYVVSQEIRWLDDHSGLVFNHTFGKTLRGAKAKK